MLCWPLDSQLDELPHLKLSGNLKFLKSPRELVNRIATILKRVPESFFFFGPSSYAVIAYLW